MAQIVFLTTGIVYDTDKQTAQLHQVVERFMLGDSINEKCVISEVSFDERAGYTYTLIGVKSCRIISTRFIFDERAAASGVYADLEYPSFMAAEQVAQLAARAATAELERQRLETIAAQRLHRGAMVVDYSEKCLAIFTNEPSDAAVLEHIHAKRNSSLTYQGRKVAGWIFPKYRKEQLAAVVAL